MSVIYKIICVATDSFYVGSSNSFKRRRWEHTAALKKGTHHCAALQAAWNLYGQDAFEFEIVEEVEAERVLLVEDIYLALNAGNANCYNTAYTTQDASSADKEVREKISATLRSMYVDKTQHPRYGKTHSEETRRVLSEKMKGKMAGGKHYRFGKTVSDEVKKKIGDTQRGVKKGPRVLTEAGRAKIKASAAAGNYDHWTGRSHTQEAREKMGKRAIVTAPDGAKTEYATITLLLEALSLKMPTATRALKSGKPISKGRLKGWAFAYATKIS